MIDHTTWTNDDFKSAKILAEILNKDENANARIRKRFLAFTNRYQSHMAALRVLPDHSRVYYLKLLKEDALNTIKQNKSYNYEVKKFANNLIVGLFRIEMRPLMHTKITKRENNSRLEDFRSALLSIYDSLKLVDNDNEEPLWFDETLTEIMFRKMKAYNIDLNKELGFTHLKPTKKKK